MLHGTHSGEARAKFLFDHIRHDEKMENICRKIDRSIAGSAGTLSWKLTISNDVWNKTIKISNVLYFLGLEHAI